MSDKGVEFEPGVTLYAGTDTAVVDLVKWWRTHGHEAKLYGFSIAVITFTVGMRRLFDGKPPTRLIFDGGKR